MNSWVRRREGPITVLTLTRPPINTLDREALNELADAVKGVHSDQEARVLVILSGIEGIFCSGGDLKYWREVPSGKEVSEIGRNVFTQIERLPKPTIAAINGHVIGDGLALALACDLRIASYTATFRLPEAAYGFIPGWGLIHRLIASVGRTNASEFLLTGQPVDAFRACRMGLLNDVIPSDRLMEEVLKRSRQMAALSPAALRAAKCALLGGAEEACFEVTWNKKDWQEGIDALLSKRSPVYQVGSEGGEECDHIGGFQAD